MLNAIHLFNGLSHASTLFLMAAGLTLIFGVTRIVNFAHGSFYMLGALLSAHIVTLWLPSRTSLLALLVSMARMSRMSRHANDTRAETTMMSVALQEALRGTPPPTRG